jgi:HAD superfamily hydrolase (TIGR01509 family)
VFKQGLNRMSGNEFPAVLFDLEGTLIDSVYEHVRAWRESLENAGRIVPAWKIHRRIGMGGNSFVKELLREMGPKRRPINLDELEHGHDVRFARTISTLQPLPGTTDLLRHLHQSKIRIAVATAGNRKHTPLLLKKLKLPTGTSVLTGDDVKNTKPAPDIFIAAAESLGIPINDCIVVGDSVWDLIAAGRKGAISVGFLSGGYGADELGRAGALRIYSDPADMLLHLEQLGLPGLA